MSAQKDLLAKYGVPDAAYQAKHCVLWKIQEDFPWFNKVLNTATDDPDDVVNRIMINKDFKARLMIAFKNLEKAGIHTEIKTYDGCYNPRSVRGRSTTSLHAWCAAIDLNAATERLAQLKTNWSGQFLAIMKAAGIFCGADWKGRKDSMHFGLYNG